MSGYNFKRLLQKYATSPVYALMEGQGHRDPYNGGEWVPGEITEAEIDGAAVVPLSNEDLRFDEGGTYNAEDRKLYCHEDVALGTKIKHRDSVYTALERRDYSEHAKGGLYIYFMKRGDGD